MKKRFSVIIALIMVLAIAVPVLASCVNEKDVKSIEVVEPTTTFKVGETIDYDNLKIKVTYEDNSTETKTVKALKATYTKADLSKVGNTSYTVTFKGKTATVNIVVEENQQGDIKDFQAQTFVEPSFYTNYRTKSQIGSEEETRADFRIKGEVYEVGNANKFIFRPTATGLDLEEHNIQTVTNVKTTAKVYSKDTKGGTYAEITGDDLSQFVTIDDNTYKFSEEAAGKFVKLEISIDSEEYDVSTLEESLRTITVECVIVDGGYNVYNQLGLSVMNDMQKQAWADLWGAAATWDNTSKTYVLSPKSGETPVQLEADSEPLYTYVGNIKWVVIHSGFELDANQMPSSYFWSETDEDYNTAMSSISGLEDMQAKLKGSLKDGTNNSTTYRVLDLIPGTATVAETGISVNMQKGLFSTSKVSVSGNYNSVIVSAEYKAGERNLITVVDHGGNSDSLPPAPVPHWAVFQIHMPISVEGIEKSYDIKNLSMKGNCAKDDIDADTKAKGVPAGMMMANCYANNMTFGNIISETFFTNVVVDGFGATVQTPEGSIEAPTGVDILNSKFYDSYSNMCYMWRSNVNIENSELIGAGGPLFILADGQSHFVDDAVQHTDDEGANLTVDTDSVLESYATGNESWYATYNAGPIINQFKGTLDPMLRNFNKTIIKTENKLDYINLIAAIVPSTDLIFKGHSNNRLLDVCGTFMTKDGETVIDQFNMHNNYLVALRANANNNAKNFPIILQTGENFMFTDGRELYTLGTNGAQKFDPATDGVKWASDTHTKLAIYLSAGSLPVGTSVSPYFGVIVQLDQLQKAN